MKVIQQERISYEAKCWGIVGATIIIGGATIIGALVHRHYNLPEYLRGQELEGKCIYILPSEGKKTNYMLRDEKNERIVTVEHYNTWRWGDACLKMWLGNVCFESKGISPKNIRILETLRIKKEKEWEIFPEGKIQNYYLWQKEYEGLIDKIAERREKFERNALEKIE